MSHKASHGLSPGSSLISLPSTLPLVHSVQNKQTNKQTNKKRPPSCFWNTPAMFPLQGLCTGPKTQDEYLHSWLAHCYGLNCVLQKDILTLAWKIPWMEEPGRLQSIGSQTVDTTERLHFHFSLSCIGKGNGNPLQYSCLENPRDRGAWWAAVYGVAQSQTWLKQLSRIPGTCECGLTWKSGLCRCNPVKMKSLKWGVIQHDRCL